MGVGEKEETVSGFVKQTKGAQDSILAMVHYVQRKQEDESDI